MLELDHCVLFDKTAQSLDSGLKHLLKKGDASIQNTKEKLPQYLRKVHATVSKGGNMQDAMIFEKIIEMQAKNSQALSDMVAKLNVERREEAKEMQAQNQKMMAELRRMSKEDADKQNAAWEKRFKSARQSEEAKLHAMETT